MELFEFGRICLNICFTSDFLPLFLSLSLSFSLQSHFFSLSGGAKGILRSAIYPQLKNFSIENNKKLTRSSRTENGEKIKLTVLTLGLKLVTSLKKFNLVFNKSDGHFRHLLQAIHNTDNLDVSGI